MLWLSQEVFENARVNTIISIIQKAAPGNVFVYICDPSKNKNISILQERLYEQKKFISEDYFIGIFETGLDSTLLDKLIRISRPLKDFARPCTGYNPYEVGKGKSPKGGPQTEETVRTKPYHSTEKLGPEWKPEIIGRDLERYCVKVTGKRWINYGSWLAAPRDSGNFLGKRILVQEITGGHDRRIVAGFFNGELYHSRDVIPIKFDNEIINPFYILGIINSRLITWYHHMRNPKAQKALFPKVLVSDLSNLPMRNINFSDPAEKTTHDRMVSLVERMLSLHKQSA
ncbi:MAG: hypothetical protein IMZ61_10845, partial [Planctomycetes bacterium]|nr:hypothetical protein [Planctomycetota bacterium]